MSLAHQIAQTLAAEKGKKPKPNGEGYNSFCPVHEDYNEPSLSIKDYTNKQGNPDVVVNCFYGCKYKDIKDKLREDGLLPEWKPGRWNNGNGKGQHQNKTQPKTKKPEPKQEQDSFPWKMAKKDEEGKGIIKKYFRSRAIRLDGEVLSFPSCLRFGSYHDKETGQQVHQIVAAATNLDDQSVKAVQRLFLDFETCKKTGAKMLGQMKDHGRGVWFFRKQPKRVLVIGEGIETTLSVMQATGMNGVASLSASGTTNLRFPDETEIVYILADSDLPPKGEAERGGFAGQRAAIELAERLEKEGRTAYLVGPDDTCFTDEPAKLDFNDLLQDDPAGDSIRARIEKAVQLKDLDWKPRDLQEGVKIEFGDDELNELLEKTKDDPGVPHKTEVIDKLALLKQHDKSRFMQVRQGIKDANRNVILKELDQDIDALYKKHKKESSSASKSDFPNIPAPVLQVLGSETIYSFHQALVVQNENGEDSLAPQSHAAQGISRVIEGKFAFDQEGLFWREFDGSCWREYSANSFAVVMTTLMYIGTDPLGFSNNYLTNVTFLLQKSGWNLLPQPKSESIPFQNGLLNIDTGQLEPITPSKAMTWVIPFEYQRDADCPNFKHWLHIAVDGDERTILLLQAWINALLTGRPDLQIFLHLIGPAGTGKSTFGRLVFILVGEENCTTTSLKQLETNRFECANIFGKRLVAIEEADKYGGSVNVLKAMTGEDPLRLERKNQQQKGSFIYTGQTLMMSNERLASTDYTSGIERRRITVEFKRLITKEEKASWAAQGGEKEILYKEAPGIIRWALGLTRDEVTEIFREVPGRIAKANLDAARFNNPIVNWMTQNLLPAEGTATQIGNKQEYREEGEIFFRYSDERLYPNYLKWCQENGHQTVALQRFTSALIEAARSYGVNAEKVRKSDGTKIYGLRLRTRYEDSWLSKLEKDYGAAEPTKEDMFNKFPGIGAVENQETAIPEGWEEV